MVDPTDRHVLSETLNKLGQEPLGQADDETFGCVTFAMNSRFHGGWMKDLD